MQGLPQRNLHQFILWKVAPSRMLVLQDQEWLQIWGKVLLCTSPGWWTALQKVQNEWWQKCSGHVEEEWSARKHTATRCQSWHKSRQTGETRCQAWYLSWVETRTCWTTIIERTTIGLCLSRDEAAEVYLTEELRHAETNPTCEIHESCCTSR